MAYANTNSSDWDQGDYLKIALWISEGGAFSDGNRNPLYPLILAPLATRSMTFFTTAKLLSVAIGCVGLAIAASVARQHVGIAGALATTALLANNIEYQIAAAHVDVEVLLAPLFFLAWHLCGRMMTEFASDHQPRVNTVLAAGAVTGLSYLAKGTGLLIVPIVLAMMTLELRWEWLLRKQVWYYVLAFSVVALPLWSFNWSEYGNPLYNFNTTHYMWNDSWENNYVYSEDELPTVWTFLGTHSVGEIGERLVNGLAIAPRQWHGALRVISADKPPMLRTATILTITATLLTVIFRRRTVWQRARSWILFSVIGMVGFALLFAWYHPISDKPRFLLPWAPVAYLATVWAMQQVLTPLGIGRIHTAAILSIAVFCTVQAQGLREGIHSIDLMYEHDLAAYAEGQNTMARLLESTCPGDAIALGPTHGLPSWLAHDRHILRIPYTRTTWAVFESWLAQNEIEYVVLDEEVWRRRRSLLERYFRWESAGLSADELPYGWHLVEPQTWPCQICVLAFESAVFQPEVTQYARFDAGIALRGFTIRPAANGSEEVLEIVLIWELLEPVEETTHVFVHALDSDNRLVTQSDGPLIADLRYTLDEDFPAGTVIRDVHTLATQLPEHGAVYVGLYRWDTMQRLVITDPESLTSQDAVRIQ